MYPENTIRRLNAGSMLARRRRANIPTLNQQLVNVLEFAG